MFLDTIGVWGDNNRAQSAVWRRSISIRRAKAVEDYLRALLSQEMHARSWRLFSWGAGAGAGEPSGSPDPAGLRFIRIAILGVK